MCGATGAQTQIQQEQADFYANATAEAKTAFGEQQGLLSNLESIYNPILAKGPNQKGFSVDEENDLNAQAIDGTAQNYQKAAKAVNGQLAAEGGGDTFMPNGAAD